MKKIVMCVWNDFDFDDRVKKKAISLSKKYQVVVKSVCKSKKQFNHRSVNSNLIVNYYCFSNKFNWFVYRFIFNKHFWKDKIEIANIYDCNDPDTLYAGKLAKIKFSCKIVYDSHEYWKKVYKKENNFLMTIYSYLFSKQLYFFEKRLISFVDKVICVSPSICKLISNKYNLKTHLICNFSNFLNFPLKKKKQVVFVGARLRKGADKFLNYFKNKKYNVSVIGNVSNKEKNINYLGYISKNEYLKVLNSSLVGINYYDIACDNIRYSLPNKFFEYIQTNCVVIYNSEMIDISKIVQKYNLGLSLKNIDFKKLDEQLNILLNDSRLYDRFKLAKKELSWENQEKDLFKIYSDLI